MARRSTRLIAASFTAAAVLVGAGLVGRQHLASAAANVSFDSGTGMSFIINGTNGNITSLKHNGVELAASGQAAGQFQSGWESATVTSKTFSNGALLTTVANSSIGVTMYYFARKNDNTVYLATNITKALNPGEARFITRLKSSLLTTSPVAAKTANSTSTVEGSDVFAFANGQTASKFYSSQRFITQQPFGASGNGHGVYLTGGSHEMSSGGPFFRDIEVNDTGSAVNITHYMFSGHEQTESLRLGLHGPYYMSLTDGAAPAARSLDFLSAYIPGLVPDAQRGAVQGTATGSWRGKLDGTVALAGTAGQYWGTVKSGAYVIGHVKPGTYTATLYAGELAVGSTKSVTVTAGSTATLALSGDTPANGTLFQLGTFDGTPAGFRNADKIETMHPSDSRMSSWKPGTVAVSAGAATFPMAQFKEVNSPQALSFTLSSVPAAGAKLRIATTGSFAGGRPQITVGGWTSPASASPAPVNLDSRGITRGTWRGVNATYTFTIPASALKTGTNTLSIATISGSSGATFLSPNYVFDALALDPA
ncbi:rhamnogalacturonan lyase B N-terminal domain-containing protein [Actinoplanes sp. RD1]|uniref:rhamnogalacturonan lyase B N-terminal domain-containing protein n=1 Tax=Actinoplanes sp. RD1 TaxID=3064538 RepID=UPI00274258B0|nr:rhamnogalacturonan lyase B N-terminal domain-containing protein [Actinoplanes sp. RD1]